MRTRLDRWVRQRVRSFGGFTLIELLVTLLIGMVLTLAVLGTHTQLSKTSMHLGDVAERDDQSRAALKLASHDISNAMYMVGGPASRCEVLLDYNGNPANPVSQSSGVAATVQPTALPAITSVTNSLYDPRNYVRTAVGGTNTTHMIAIDVVDTALRAPTTATYSDDPYKQVHNAVTTATAGQDAVRSGVLPLNSVSNIAVGDILTVKLPVTNGTRNALVCLSFPVGTVTAASANFPASVQMKAPGNFALFNAALQASGATAAALGNAHFRAAKVRNNGAPSALGATETIVYYIGKLSSGVTSRTVPALVRAVISSDGSLAAQPVPVAAGVVNLQALYGVDADGSGGVSRYLTWSSVVSLQLTGKVRSVLFAVVSRSMQSNSKNPLVTSVAIPSPNLATGDATFAPYFPVDSDEQRDRFSVLTTEVVLRNRIWN